MFMSPDVYISHAGIGRALVFMFCFLLQVRDIALHPEMFSVQNGLLTPTLKAKRNELQSRFREQIDKLYATIKM